MDSVTKQRCINDVEEVVMSALPSLEDLNRAISKCDLLIRINPFDLEIIDTRNNLLGRLSRMEK